MSRPSTTEELTIAREGDDRMAAREELEKKVLVSGAWATVAYIFKEYKKTKKEEGWSTPRFALVRYQKRGGVYSFKKEFAFTNLEHVKDLHETLGGWLTAHGDAGGD